MQKADMAKADRLREMSGVNTRKCMKCGKCSATCPAYEEMDIRPHQFVSYVENGDIEPLLNSTTIWKCLSCFACVERCPRDVKPAKLIEAVRQMVVRQRQLFKPQRDTRITGRGIAPAAAGQRVPQIQQIIRR